MSEKVVVEGSGSGVAWILFFIFMTLKLTGSITWNWWWVTAPLWGVLAFGLALMAIGGLALIVLAITEAVSMSSKRKKKHGF